MAALYPIHPGMTARLLDGGALTVVAVQRASRGALSLVLRTDGLYGRQVIVSYDAVSHVDNVVHLRLSAHEVQALPTFDPIWHGRTLQQPHA
jgi:hypothetical protein